MNPASCLHLCKGKVSHFEDSINVVTHTLLKHNYNLSFMEILPAGKLFTTGLSGMLWIP